MTHPYSDWAILAIFVFTYSLIAGRLSRTWLSDAIVFSLFGLLFGDFGLQWVQFNVTSENLKTIAELTLSLILFTDAAKANLRVLKNSLRLPWRLLAVSLPLTIGLGLITSKFLFPQFSWVEASLLATMVAPTDAALGKAVVSNPQVPDSIREDLNVESGLNDGICVPILFTLVAIASPEHGSSEVGGLLLTLSLQQIGIGVLVGASFAAIAVHLREACLKRGWIAEDWQPILAIALAIACFATAQHYGGSGFIACFIGGLTFGSLVTTQKEAFLIAAEATGDALSLITWVAFGASVVPLVLRGLTGPAFLYALLSLTLIRLLSVWLAVLGMGLDRWSKLFVGWFGPRGLASIVFIVIVLDADLTHSQDIAMVASCTILLSVLAHGMTATPLAHWYGQWQRRQT
jgi:NhaP-type Na+/H+ or K+/H+ antiporter